ncbi:hypothetical protein Pmani_029887 [Petrolisthes manimaculis]|uniref:Uncharacterized protein n=1 Tax=Petrolisthes manimaculis TaxID=1843537 RepID=A0AAE1NYG4_9EUCA|nr:hypothetical protein Pmani_029887 [Petrolisthes manimaculis]
MSCGSWRTVSPDSHSQKFCLITLCPLRLPSTIFYQSALCLLQGHIFCSRVTFLSIIPQAQNGPGRDGTWSGRTDRYNHFPLHIFGDDEGQKVWWWRRKGNSFHKPLLCLTLQRQGLTDRGSSPNQLDFIPLNDTTLQLEGETRGESSLRQTYIAPATPKPN